MRIITKASSFPGLIGCQRRQPIRPGNEDVTKVNIIGAARSLGASDARSGLFQVR